MDPIIPIREWISFDGNEKKRNMVLLPDGRTMYKSRLLMMNFLHTQFIPSKIHVHHENEISNADTITNLCILSSSDHSSLHHPLDRSRYGISVTEDKKAYMKFYNKEYLQRNKGNVEFKKKAAAWAIKRYNEKLKDDPVFIEHKNSIDRRSYKNRMKNPEYAAKRKAQKRAWEIKNKQKVTGADYAICEL